MFYIDAVAIGQMYGTVPSTVRSELLFDYTNSALESLEYTQRVGRECTNLRYTIFSNNNYETLTLKPVEMPNVLHKNEHRFDMMVDVINRGWRELLSDLVINVTLLPAHWDFCSRTTHVITAILHLYNTTYPVTLAPKLSRETVHYG